MNTVHLVPITARQTRTVYLYPDRLNAIADLVTLEMASVVMLSFHSQHAIPKIPVISFVKLEDWSFFLLKQGKINRSM